MPADYSHDDTPNIYVASLTDYNAGRLHGAWIDASQDVDDIFDDIQDMLAASPANRGRGVRVSVPKPPSVAEEWAIHDYENFGELRLDEYENIAHVSRAAQMIVEHGEVAAEVIAHVGGIEYLDEAQETLEDRFMGSYEDLTSWAVEYLEGSLDGLPEQLRYYFDYESFARDAVMSGEMFTIEADGQVHIFSNT